MPQFRNIDYARSLYETMRAYYSLNVDLDLSQLFMYCYAFLNVLQAPFDAYAAERLINQLVANCKWQIGQLTNVLNMLYDAMLKRIFITQNTLLIIADPTFLYPPDHFDSDFFTAPEIFERGFFDRSAQTVVTINVPVSIDLASITSVINQIRLQGIPYVIVQF